MKNLSLILLALCAQCIVSSQIHPTFQSLDFSNCSSTFFWNQIPGSCQPPNGNDYTSLSYFETLDLLANFQKADTDSVNEILPEYDILSNALRLKRNSDYVIPISIVEMKYNYIKEESATNGWVFMANNLMFQIPNAPNIFEEEDALVLHVASQEYAANDLQFVLDDDFYFQNFGSMPQTVQIDFDDGLGFQTITLNQIMSVHYTTTDIDRNIRVNVIRDGVTKKGAQYLKHNDCASNYDFPVFPVPWTTVPEPNPDIPINLWRIATTYNGEEVFGDAYYLPSGAFDKPFIFVEGIDFPKEDYSYFQHHKNGEFGWCQFTSGISDPTYDYAMLHRMPDLLDAVRAHDYDIIFLDFSYGADLLEKNGALLVHLIQMVNDAKVGNEPNVIAGASMGGQISKYALDYMERNDMDHCTRLWISLDSPHTGANVPIGIQQLMHMGENTGSPSAIEAVSEKLRAPATKQLLNVQYTDLPPSQQYAPPANVAWYAKMEEWGYPTNCRKVGIANGNMNGIGLPYSANDKILSYACEKVFCSTRPEAKFFIAHSAGDPLYTDVWGIQSTGSNYVSTQFVKSQLQWTDAFFGLFNLFCNMPKQIQTATVPAGSLNWDYAPGGVRNSILEVVKGINENEDFVDSGCDLIDAGNYKLLHSFVPTQSALGLKGLDPFTSINEYLDDHPEKKYFDRFDGPEDGNEPHSNISEVTLSLMIAEITSGENPDGSPLLPINFTSQAPNNGIFNYGLEGFNYIRSMHIHSGGQVNVNKNMTLHYGLNSEGIPDDQSIFKITTWSGCAASDILVDNMGKLEIGDAVNTRRAELTLRPDSKLTIGQNGILKINPGSKIIVENGAELIIYPYSNVVVDNGSIIVKAGGKLTIHAGANNGDVASISLLNTDAVLVFDGGELHIAPGTTFQPTHENAESGYIEFKGADNAELITGENSKFILIGDGPDDVMLKMNGYADLQNANWSMGKIHLEQCKVDLSDHGRLWTDMDFYASNVHFVDEHDINASSSSPNYDIGGEVQVWATPHCSFYNCTFDRVRLYTQDSKTRLFGVQFNHARSGYYANEGSYLVQSSQFTNCNLNSSSLSRVSHIGSSAFTHGSVHDESTVNLNINNSNFDNAGVQKIGGVLNLNCNQLINQNSGVGVADGSLNMSSANGAGYNVFQNVNTCISLSNAVMLDLYEGHNDFSGFTSYAIEGTINTSCLQQSCDLTMDARGNYWGAQTEDPWNPSP